MYVINCLYVFRNNANNVYSENKKLTNGIYCSLGPRPNSNPRTTTTMMTINSVVCRSKYPNLFGGTNVNHIAACKNSDPFCGTASSMNR